MPRFPAVAVATALAAGALALPTAVVAATFSGRATDPDTGRLLYTETHEVSADGARETVTYLKPDGGALGTKTLDYRGAPYLPLYRLSLEADGYTEALTRRGTDGQTVTLEKKSTRADPARTAEVTADDSRPLAADAGAQRLIVDHLPELAAGTVLPFRLAVAGRLSSYRLRVKKEGETREGLAVVVQPDSLLRFLTPDLHMVFDPVHRRLVRYEGISNVQDPATGKAFGAVRLVYAY